TPRLVDLTGTVFALGDPITNLAPVLDNSGAPYLIAPAGDRLPEEMLRGLSVSDLLATGAGGHPITDADAGAQSGIALIGVDNSLGRWQYTLSANASSSSANWTDVDQTGALSAASALLLPTDARVRFVTTLIPHHAAAPPFLS